MKPASLLAPIAALVCGVHVFAAEALTTRPLFNGKDLSGWKGVGYVVEDGAITCTPKGRTLITEETFSNFVLDFEFQLAPGANNGLGIHYPGSGDAAYTGMEIQILDSTAPKYKDLKDFQFHGGLYTMAPARQGFLKPVGEWNQQRVTVMGPALKVELNGEIILRVNLDEMSAKFPKHEGVKRRAGHIAWLGHGDRVAFRNINIGELPPVADEDGVKAGEQSATSRAADRLSPSEFAEPPTHARPGCFWDWLNGAMTPEQITHDLEAMKQGGMRGGEIWDVAAMADPDKQVPGGPAFLGPESIRLIAHPIREANRLGMEIVIVASSGWNAGGSWVTPEYAGKALYQSTTTVSGYLGVPRTREFEVQIDGEDAPFNVTTVDGKEVWRREVGQ